MRTSDTEESIKYQWFYQKYRLKIFYAIAPVF